MTQRGQGRHPVGARPDLLKDGHRTSHGLRTRRVKGELEELGRVAALTFLKAVNRVTVVEDDIPTPRDSCKMEMDSTPNVKFRTRDVGNTRLVITPLIDFTYEDV